MSKENANQVARHLVMTFQLLDEDPERALAHAQAAQRRAGRVGVVREAAGLAAYQGGAFDLALRELRAARRLTGSQLHLPVMADCERGLGRPERALALASSPEARMLDRRGQLEMLMVAAGARQDLGQNEAAVVMLQVPELTTPHAVNRARLLSAYADALEAAGRHEESAEWLRRAAAEDVEGETGAAERLGQVADEEITDLLEGMDDDAPLPRDETEPSERGGADLEDGQPRSGNESTTRDTDADPREADEDLLGEDGMVSVTAVDGGRHRSDGPIDDEPAADEPADDDKQAEAERTDNEPAGDEPADDDKQAEAERTDNEPAGDEPGDKTGNRTAT